MLAASARTEPGDLGYQPSPSDYLNADQQGLRLMLDETSDGSEWSVHLRTVRLHSDSFVAATTHSSALFRYDELASEPLDRSSDNVTTLVRAEVDRLHYRQRFGSTTLDIGRQPLDWGSGRFWQPLNIFGAFSPTDLDTDYKPGIDALNLEYYPSALSSLSGVYAFAPRDSDKVEDSAAMHYRRQVGDESELTLVAGSISGNRAVGAAFESVWGDVAWRIEGLYYTLQEDDEDSLFWIAGLDYQFDDGTLLSAEYYDNSRGASSEAALAGIYNDELIASGLQQQLSRQLFGLGVARDLTPLLHGGYTLLSSIIKDSDGDGARSLLHQFNLTYSVSNESDLLASLLLPTGKGLSTSSEPRSEFGHVPASLTLRLRFYF